MSKMSDNIFFKDGKTYDKNFIDIFVQGQLRATVATYSIGVAMRTFEDCKHVTKHYHEVK